MPLLLDFPVIGRQAHRGLIPPSCQIDFLQFLRKLRQLQPKHRVACINGDFFMSIRQEPPKFCNIRNAASMELSVLHSPRNAEQIGQSLMQEKVARISLFAFFKQPYTPIKFS